MTLLAPPLTQTQSSEIVPAIDQTVAPQKKQGAEERRREEYRRKQAEIEKLQKENMMAMYPELYGAAVAVGGELTVGGEPEEEEDEG